MVKRSNIPKRRIRLAGQHVEINFKFSAFGTIPVPSDPELGVFPPRYQPERPVFGIHRPSTNDARRIVDCIAVPELYRATVAGLIPQNETLEQQENGVFLGCVSRLEIAASTGADTRRASSGCISRSHCRRISAIKSSAAMSRRSLTNIPQIGGLLRVMLRPVAPRCNKIRLASSYAGSQIAGFKIGRSTESLVRVRATLQNLRLSGSFLGPGLSMGYTSRK